MSLFFRKSLKLGPIRLNLGKSGIGVSAGIKGIRVGTGPRGNYISAGKGGIYYRKTLSGAQRQNGPKTTVPASIESAALFPPRHAKRRPIWVFITVVSGATCCLLAAAAGASRDTVGAIMASAIVVVLVVWVTHHRMKADELEPPSNSNQELLPGYSLPEDPLYQVQPRVVETTALPETTRKKPSLAELRDAEKKAKSLVSLTSQTWNAENYALPGFALLDAHDTEARTTANTAELEQIQQVLIEALRQFGIDVVAGDITKGPTITRYEVYPAQGVRMDKILALERDLARIMSAGEINILAPIPGKNAVGIELANTRKAKVTLRELLQSQAWQDAKTHSGIPLALGKDVYGKTVVADLATAPHFLVAGMRGSGKSACIDTIIASLLFRFTPEEIRLVLISPHLSQMQSYSSVPHLAFPVVTDPKKTLLAMRWLIDEMEKRYRIFAQTDVRRITAFNGRATTNKDDELNGELVIPDRMPYVIVVIDELADLNPATLGELESALERIVPISDGAGIHLILSTKTPLHNFSAVLKANIPSRIAFQVRTEADSHSILDENGADHLLGEGDMLYRSSGTPLIRLQGGLAAEEEIHRLVEFVSAQSPPAFDLVVSSASAEDVTEEDEELVEKCLEIIRQEKRASTSLLQRRLRLGYTRAARVVDILEQRGILGPGEGAKPREILVDLDAAV